MPPFPPQGAVYLTLLSRHSLGNGTMVMLVLLSLRWGMKDADYILAYVENGQVHISDEYGTGNTSH
ncbi:MAG: hypothetical protein WBI82_12540 [Sphaerochaeta sp.]